MSDDNFKNLPQVACEFIKLVIKKMCYRKKIRVDVQAELAAHFEDALKDCKTDEEKEKTTQKLIEDFGDPKLLAVLMRRGKKRCRSLWRKVVAHSLQVLGGTIVLFVLYTLWFISGKANVKVDYLALVNEKQKSLKAIISDGDNAWLNYNKAVELYIEPKQAISELIEEKGLFPYEKDLTQEQRALITEWIKQNEPAWEQLNAGSRKPYYYFEMKYEDSNKEKALDQVPYPIHPFWRHMRTLWFWRISAAAEQENIKQATEDCLVQLRVSRHMAKDNTILVDHMMAGLSTREALNAMLQIVSTNKSAEQLRSLQERLSLIFPQGYPDLSFCIEVRRLLAMDAVQRVFTDGGPGGGHLITRKFWKAYVFDKSSLPFGLDIVSPYLLPMVHAGRDETIAKINEHLDYMAKDYQMSSYQWREKGSMSADFALSLGKYRYFFIHHGPQSMRGRCDREFETKSQYEATLTILAALRWNLDKGRYPDSLDELVSNGYLKKLPMDQYSDKPLVYKKTDDSFMLYSLGKDFDDDGGIHNKYWGIADESGDSVFWPIQK